MAEDRSHTGLLGYLMDFYLDSGKQDLALAYEGRINPRLIDAFGSLIADHLLHRDYHSELKDILVEMLKDPFQDNDSIKKKQFNNTVITKPTEVLLISHDNLFIQFASGKMIENKDISSLRQFFDKINSLEGGELDSLKTYKEEYYNGNEKPVNCKGFIDIKKITGQNLESHFLPYDKTRSYFLIISRISKN